MRRTFCGFVFAGALLTLASGCGGSGDKVLKNDPKVSAKNEADYKQKMEEAMKNRPQPTKPKYGGK